MVLLLYTVWGLQLLWAGLQQKKFCEDSLTAAVVDFHYFWGLNSLWLRSEQRLTLRASERTISTTFLQDMQMPRECFSKLREGCVATRSGRTHGWRRRCPASSSHGACRVNYELWCKACHPGATLPLWSLQNVHQGLTGLEGVNKFTAVSPTWEATVKRYDSSEQRWKLQKLE